MDDEKMAEANMEAMIKEAQINAMEVLGSGIVNSMVTNFPDFLEVNLSFKYKLIGSGSEVTTNNRAFKDTGVFVFGVKTE